MNSQAALDSSPADAVPSTLVDHLPARWKPYARLARLDRPIGTWLLYWPCVFGLILGAAAEERRLLEWQDVWYLVLFAVGALVMRGAGCTFNDIIDRKIDAQVARTRGRPIASGAVSVTQAAAFLVAQCLIGLAILLQLNWFAVALGAASLLLVAAYPFMKRITWWPQAWLGLTFNWGALLGFAAQTGRIDLGDAVLYAGLFFWTLGYDTIYAHQDKEDDELIGVKSTARLLGASSARWILRFYAVSFTLILAAGFIEHTGWPFAPLMLLAGAHMLWQVRRLDTDDSANCLRLFRSNRETGALIALALAAASWFG
ncbi:MAG: 4-hydroxybenzoate polyprenyltransferase [Alphaproteobacteria bacterium 64-11]|nr:4-hydroxybenzoate octaprenyltransferase [Alphaproteobacteria bacterium]OJU09969.1 MAG: 4-hydroxybenzoate polyprenyltransferase [Alphaproteobacteria bacterium 64-11]